MTTFAGWLGDQRERQDQVGEIARLWTRISPGRTHSVQGVTKALLEHAEQHTEAWVPEAVAATAEEYRMWKVNPEGASIAAPVTRNQLDRIEAMLERLLDSLGLPLEDPPQLAASEGQTITEQAGVVVPLTGHPDKGTPYIKAEGGLGFRSGRPITTEDVARVRQEQAQAELAKNVQRHIEHPEIPAPGWGTMYAAADHDLPEGAELGEQAE